MSDYTQAVTAESFQQVVIAQSHQRPVIVDFWAEWCGPCKQLMPVLHQLVENLHGEVALATVNTDEQQQLAMQFGVRSLPTLLIFSNGEVVEQSMGVKPESEILALLKPYLEDNKKSEQDIKVSDNMQIALDYMQSGQVDDAIAQLISDESAESQTLLLKLYLQERQLENAKNLHSKFNDELKQQQQVQLIMHIIDLLVLADQASNDVVKNTIIHVVDKDVQSGLELLLDLMSQSDESEEKDLLKNSVIIGFNLLEDKSIVSKLRRQLSSMVFN